MVTAQKIISKSPEETIKLGARIARYFKAGSIVCLMGDLGSGKTTLIQGIAQGLKISKTKVNSPTFVLMNVYYGKLPLYHFDLYRLGDMNDIHSIGYEEFLYGDGVAVVEWAERLDSLMPEEYLKIDLTHKKLNEREIKISAQGAKYKEILKKI